MSELTGPVELLRKGARYLIDDGLGDVEGQALAVDQVQHLLRGRRPGPRYRHWRLRQLLSPGFLLDGLGTLLPAVLRDQAIDIILGDTQGIGLGPGNGLNLLPILVGGQALQALTDNTA
jgi:hypothetical protein